MRKFVLFAMTLLFSYAILAQEDKEIKINQKINKSTMQGLRTVAYFVADLEAAKAWYSKAFQTRPYFDEPFYVGFNIGGYELGLQPEEQSTVPKTANVIVYWGVGDIEKEFKRLIALGATEHEKPTNVGGELVVASVKDPWGNVIGLIYNPEFKLKD